MQTGAEFSPCKTYRYALWRRWSDAPPVLFVMLNPSTANESQDDPTIRRCISFAKQWGHGGIIVGNLFAFRSPYPTDLSNSHRPNRAGEQSLARAFGQAKHCSRWRLGQSRHTYEQRPRSRGTLPIHAVLGPYQAWATPPSSLCARDDFAHLCSVGPCPHKHQSTQHLPPA